MIHNSRRVYKCGVGDCERTFVRLDRCKEHLERHTKRPDRYDRSNFAGLDMVSKATPSPALTASPSVSPPTFGSIPGYVSRLPLAPPYAMDYLKGCFDDIPFKGHYPGDIYDPIPPPPAPAPAPALNENKQF